MDANIVPRFILVLAFCAATTACHAGEFAMAGNGPHKSCGDFLATSTNVGVGKMGSLTANDGAAMVTENQTYLEWARGFVSAANFLTDLQPAKDDLGAGFDLWLRNWCGAHPTKQFYRAVSAYLKEEGTIK